MTRRITLAIALAIAASAAIAAPASARWDGDGRWRDDTRWHNYNDRYYGYYSPPVIYNNTPGFTIQIR